MVLGGACSPRVGPDTHALSTSASHLEVGLGGIGDNRDIASAACPRLSSTRAMLNRIRASWLTSYASSSSLPRQAALILTAAPLARWRDAGRIGFAVDDGWCLSGRERELPKAKTSATQRTLLFIIEPFLCRSGVGRSRHRNARRFLCNGRRLCLVSCLYVPTFRRGLPTDRGSAVERSSCRAGQASASAFLLPVPKLVTQSAASPQAAAQPYRYRQPQDSDGCTPSTMPELLRAGFCMR